MDLRTKNRLKEHSLSGHLLRSWMVKGRPHRDGEELFICDCGWAGWLKVNIF